MKNLSKALAVILLLALVLGLGATAAFAEGEGSGQTQTADTHVITITNTDQNVSHTYQAYKVFSGDLNADETILSNIQWGNGVNGTALLAALVGTTDPSLKAVAADITNGKDALGKEISVGDSLFKNCTSAQDVARVLATFSSTSGLNDAAGRIDAVATIISANLGTSCGTFDEGTGANAGTYTLSVTGDGYYFIKDATTDLNNTTTSASDTLSKYLLAVIKNTTIVAKDTGITPDKKILGASGVTVAADSAAIGDKVDFEVTITVPNTKKYVDHFVFHMNDKLPAGLTFFGLNAVKIDGSALPTENYTLTVKTGENAFTVPSTVTDAVTTTGGQTINIVFNNFKAYVEANSLIGKTISIRYSAIVNQDAVFGATGNENEVKFDFSNDPNHDYTGDNFKTDDPHGTTPGSKTKTYVTTLVITKKDDEGNALEGATFTLTGTALNHVLVTGEKFEASSEASPYTAADGETVETGVYYKLKDGTYTTTVPGNTVNGVVVNTTQYADTETTYVKVSYSKVVVNTKAEGVTLTGTSDKNGVIKFEGLDAGTYTLTETIAPEGFNLLTEPLTIVIDWSNPTADGASEAIVTSGGFSVGADSSAGVTMDTNGVAFRITVVNQSGSLLPSTGGIGTTIFYILGSVLVVAAGVLLITKKRMSKEG